MLLVVVALALWTPVSSSSRVPDNESYTHVQYSNIYCKTLSSHQDVDTISCNFNQTLARLGDVDFLRNSSAQSTGNNSRTLRLEINGCSSLWISAEFQTTWKTVYSQLYLKIGDVEDVIQEEVSDYDSPSRDLISFTLRNSNMVVLHPHLMSSTSALLVEIVNCSIGFIAGSAFQDVEQIWQLRFFNTNISRIDSDAMPNFVSIAPSPAGVDVEWAPFIFNNTHFIDLQPDSIKLHVSGKDEYLNFVHCQFYNVQRKAIQITGTGHVLIADSVINRAEQDSILFTLHNNETKAPVLFEMTYPTLTLMGLRLFDVKPDNLFQNLNVGDGKLYLMRITFAFPGALQFILDHSDSWNNQSTYIERITTTCSCKEIAQLLAESASSSQSDGEKEAPTEDYPTVDHKSSIMKTPAQQMADEVSCYDEIGVLRPVQYKTTYCAPPSQTTEAVPVEATAEEPVLQDAQLAFEVDDWMVYTLAAVSGFGVLLIVAIASVQLYRKRRNFRPKKQTIGMQGPNKNQVGVLSEDPICDEDGEDEC